MFVSLAVTALASAWLAGAQDQNNTPYHAHGAVAFVRTGERTPLIRAGTPNLTATGANQMYTLGQNFRTRYITGTSPNGLGQLQIPGMSPNVLDNSQIYVQTLDTPYLIDAAQAFMQGMYPPFTMGNGTGSGDIMADGTTVNYPLNGYQYASIESSSQVDPNSVVVSGSQNCPTAEREQMIYFTTNDYLNTLSATRDLYQNLSANWFGGYLRQDQLDYAYAIDIADYLSWQYTHNSIIYRRLANDTSLNGVYDQVRWLADEQSWLLYGNTSASPPSDNNKAMAGKTLAAGILEQLGKLVVDGMDGDADDISYPLTFMFGEQDPMISLLSIMEADYLDTDFHSIPEFGSAMVFELFSVGNSSDFPTDTTDLYVRFLYHNGSGYTNNSMTAYPIFGNGPSRTDLPWSEFQDMFSRMMVGTLNDWCDTCESKSLFCWGAEGNVTYILPDDSSHKVSPVVAGVIGAIVALAVAGILFGLAMLFVGIRFHRQPRSSRKSDLGGFKGSAKLASDPDLSLAKNAAPPAIAGGAVAEGGGYKRGHERVGSWELRQKEFGKKVDEGDDLSDDRSRASFEGIEEVVRKPVEVEERV